MKKLLCLVGLGVILSLPPSTYAEILAVINVSKVFQDIVINKAVPKQLEKEFKERASELQNMEKDLQIRADKFQKSATKPNKEDINEFETKRMNFFKKAQEFEEDNQRRQKEEHKKILTIIKTATKAIAEKEHYDIVVDVNAILYEKDSSNLKNITDLVIQKVK